MRLWITEYGYQTNPPDTLFGVTPAEQAKYLRQAVRSSASTLASTCCSGSCSETSPS